MNTGKAGLELIKRYEGLHDGDLKQVGLQPKLDPIGIWTEGWGRAMRDKIGNFIRGSQNKDLAHSRISIHSIEEADLALQQDILPREYLVAQKIKIKLNQNQFDALVSYVYNTGGSDTLYKLINDEANPEKIKTWFTTKYITGDGIKLPGLVARRAAECNLFYKPV